MANTQDGVAKIRWLVEALDPLRAVADSLDKIGSLDDAITSRKAAQTEAVKAHEDAKASIEHANFKLNGLRAAHDAAIAEHAAKLDKMTADAKAQGAEIVATAKRTAEGLMSAANEHTAKITADNDKLNAQLAAQRKAIQDEIIAAQDELEALHAQHDVVAANIKAIKQAAKSILTPTP